MSIENKYIKDKGFSDLVAKTKVSHGKIETAVRVREAKSKEELDLELQRLNILKDIDNSSISEEIKLPKELQNWQQLIVVIGNLNLKSSSEVFLACKKLGYSGTLNQKIISDTLSYRRKEFFKFDKEKGWQLTNKGQNEVSRLNQFL